MKIKAVANGNVIDAHPDAAKQLIEAGIYVKADDDEPQTSEVRNNSMAPEVKPTKRRRKKA